MLILELNQEKYSWKMSLGYKIEEDNFFFARGALFSTLNLNKKSDFQFLKSKNYLF